MQLALALSAFVANFATIFFPSNAKCALYPAQLPMHSKQKNDSDFKSRLLYGAVVGAVLGMIIGTMPANDPRVAIISMGFSAAVISALCALSNSFWESLRAAWELVRMAFWRW
jgi:uncharacterized membrane protein YgaE (UPF0421/DUF939 family)